MAAVTPRPYSNLMSTDVDFQKKEVFHHNKHSSGANSITSISGTSQRAGYSTISPPGPGRGQGLGKGQGLGQGPGVVGADDVRQESGIFEFDVIGFDVDHTLCQYNLPNLYQLIYDGVCEYLIEKRGYNHKIFQREDIDWHFCMKGLILDIKRGNFLKLLDDGYIVRASHGSQPLTCEEISRIYGDQRVWPHLKYYLDISNFNNRHLQQVGFRMFEDDFQVPAAVVSAEIVDFIDAIVGQSLSAYTFWPDVLDGLVYVYNEKGFAEGSRVLHSEVRQVPSRFLVRCGEDVLVMMEALARQTNTLFLLTSASEAYVEHALSYTLGKDWKKYFDIFIYASRKPGFFTKAACKKRTFLHSDGTVADGLVHGGSYHGGNYKELESFFHRRHNSHDIKICYIGDSLQSDIVPVRSCTSWSSVGVCEGLVAAPSGGNHMWGSLLTDVKWEKDRNGNLEKTDRNTLWCKLLRGSCAFCIPSINYLAGLFNWRFVK